jgi:hypothetical protein
MLVEVSYVAFSGLCQRLVHNGGDGRVNVSFTKNA